MHRTPNDERNPERVEAIALAQARDALRQAVRVEIEAERALDVARQARQDMHKHERLAREARQKAERVTARNPEGMVRP